MQQMRVEGNSSTPQLENIHASYFFDFYDEEFLREAYARLLKRDLDPAGRAHYLDALRAGTSRYRILNDISRSKEARGAGVQLQGMLPYRSMKVASSIPVLGRIVQAAVFLWRVDALMKDLRALENHVYRVSSKVTDL